MKITKQMKADFLMTRDCWKWLSETGAYTKSDWPFHEEISTLSNNCAFCEYFMKGRGRSLKTMCKKCPLYKEASEDDSGPCCYPAYDIWTGTETKRERKKYARILYKAIDKWCKENL